MITYHVDALNHMKMPLRKELVKKGTIEIDMTETNMVEWKGRLMRFEWVRPDSMREFSPVNERTRGYGNGYFRFTDMETEEHSPAFAHGFSFGSAYVTSEVTGVETAYVYGTYGWNDGGPFRGHDYHVFWSTDLEHWEHKKLFDFPDTWRVYNSSLAKGPDGYVYALEFGGPQDTFGVNFTYQFLRSDDLINWTFMDTGRYCYSRDRYVGGAVLRYCKSDGLFYLIYLDALPGYKWAPYIVRTADFENWEIGVTNPIMYSGVEDKQIARPDKFTPEEIEYILNMPDTNNSDVDVYEFKGITYILYSWGNQVGKENLALAEYDGPLDEFLQSFFPVA